MKTFRHAGIFALTLILCFFWGCNPRKKSPEKLPQHKEKFRAQIASFEKEKEKTDEKLEEGVTSLNGLQEAINNAKNVDKEFQLVYGKWEKVNQRVKDLNREYEQLKSRADELFSAIERQVESLSDEDNKRQLLAALSKARAQYTATLDKTAIAIDKLQQTHKQATDIIKALEAAVAIGQIAKINEGLINIQTKVDDVMNELNVTIKESKGLYEKKIGEVS